MLKRSNDKTHPKFMMEVCYKRDIDISFFSIFDELEHKNNETSLIFIDPVVLANQERFLEAEEQNSNIVLVPTNLHEFNKDIESLKSILQVFEAQGIGRRQNKIYAVGGGALLDTVSLAASVFRRGVSVTKVPTTLLGIVDASIGIKTGINYLGQRNRIGSYHFDYNVVIDPQLMKGLHRGLVRQGLGEIFKIATIKSESLFEALLRNITSLEDVSFYTTCGGVDVLIKSIELMLEELHENPREDNLKRCVDFGHSFSPLLEMESLNRKGIRSIPHGYAVAFDCLLTSMISVKRGMITRQKYQKILNLYTSVDFDLCNEIYQDTELMWASFLEMTKHRGGNQNLPVPTDVGKYEFIQDLTYLEMSKSACELSEYLRTR